MNSLFLIRPVQENDLASVLAIAAQTGPGFNSLPHNVDVMKQKIATSIASISESMELSQRFYFFVIENVNNHEVIGTGGIEAKIGHPWPFYKFKLSHFTQVCQSLNRYQKHRLLNLSSDHNGATELGALYIKPSYRGEGRGTLLSRSRCLFIAIFPNLFSQLIVADMRGVSDQKAISPFWEAVGNRFFDMSYEEVSYIKATKGSQFMIDLMPRHPIYVDLLPSEVQSVIGKTHENSTPAMHVLVKEGFIYRDYIDIFDAGPTIEIYQNQLKTVRNFQKEKLVGLKKKIQVDQEMLIGNTRIDFRATLGGVELTENNEVVLEEHVAEILNVSVGEEVAYCPFY